MKANSGFIKDVVYDVGESMKILGMPRAEKENLIITLTILAVKERCKEDCPHNKKVIDIERK